MEGGVDLALKNMNQERMGVVQRARISSYATNRWLKASEGGSLCACTDNLPS